MNPNDCKEAAPHELARGIQPIPGDTPAVEELHAHIRENMKDGLTTTGYKFDCGPEEPTPGSSYNEFWDTGFAGEGDPYGIGEYTAESANPNAAPFHDTNNPKFVYSMDQDAFLDTPDHVA